MGIFDKDIEKSANELYESIKEYLSPKDDKKHILMVNTTSKLMTKGIECENQYTIQMNGIIEQMQKSGYEILDIKLDASSQIMANMTLIRTLIIYK